MSLKDLFLRLHSDERTSSPDPIAFAGRVVRGAKQSFYGETRMASEKLLIPRADTVLLGLESIHRFHRDIVSPDASPTDQVKLLRRVRRAVHTDVMCDQQLIDPGCSPEDFTVTDVDDRNTISQQVFRAGAIFYHQKSKEIDKILGHEPTFPEILMIGEDVLACDAISMLRASAKSPPSAEEENDRDEESLRLRKAMLALEPEALKLYLALEIPICWNNEEINPHPHSKSSSGEFTIDHCSSLHTNTYIAAHELCHAMIGHDFIESRIKLSHKSDNPVPEKYAEAAAELNTRMKAIASGDASIRAEYETQVGAGEHGYKKLQQEMQAWQAYSEEKLPVYTEKHKSNYEYEDVCNYYAMRQAMYAHEPNLMHFISPKMATLCDELEQETKRSLLAVQKNKEYFDNPARNKIFALIQEGYPVVKFPTKSVTLI